MRLEGGVEAHDDAGGLTVKLPGVQVDEAASTASSLGTIQFEGPGYTGTARSIVYGLRRDQETFLTE